MDNTTQGPLVEAAPGVFIRKAWGNLQDDDMIVFDGPRAFDALERAQQTLETEIKAAGGAEAWRASSPTVQKAA